MAGKNKAIDLGNDALGRLILRLAVPAVVAQIINLLYNLVDRMYVSSIPEIGTQALAGLGVVFPITLIVSAFSNLVGMGGAPLASICLGEKREEAAGKVFNGGVGLLIGFSVLLTVLVTVLSDPLVRIFGAPEDCMGYARDYLFVYGCGTVFVLLALGLNPFITAQGYSLTSMATVAIGAVINIALDPLFIFVFDMGVEGAAFATILAQGVSAGWVVLFFLRKKSRFRFRIRQWIPKLSIAVRILALGLSPFIMSVTESAIQIVFNVNLKMWSHDNSDYTAALTIMLSAIQVTSLPLNGLGTGIQPLISYNYGRGDAERIRKTVLRVGIAAFCFSTTMWGIAVFAPQVYGILFNASEAVMDILTRYMPFFMAGTICFFAQMTFQNVFVALNQARISIFLACLRKLILLIPLCFLLPYRFGVAGIYYSEGIADMVAGIATALCFFILLPRILKRREEQLKAAPSEEGARSGRG